MQRWIQPTKLAHRMCAILLTLISTLADCTSLSYEVFDPNRRQDGYLKMETFDHKTGGPKRVEGGGVGEAQSGKNKNHIWRKLGTVQISGG